MADRPAYSIVGSGYWAGRMREILTGDRRVVQVEGARRKPEESDAAYHSRLIQAFTACGAQIAWLCLAPGAHIPPITNAALAAGLHVVAEKPWLNSRADTEPLRELAAKRKLLVGLHYQYCLLDGVETWRRTYHEGAGLEFGGRFLVRRPNRIGIDAMDNLGSHLIALQNYAVPQVEACDIRCGYELAEERRAWLSKKGELVSSINFTANREPIIQRFRDRFEQAIDGAPFPFGLDFGLRVSEAIAELRWKENRSSTRS